MNNFALYALILFFSWIISLYLLNSDAIYFKIHGLIYNRYIVLSLLAFSIILGWPLDKQEAFQAGTSLDPFRIFKIVVFCSLLLWYGLYFTKHDLSLYKSAKSYIFFIFVCFISSFYSVNAMETVWKSIECLTVFVFSLVLYSEALLDHISWRDILGYIFIMYTLLLIFSVIGCLIAPGLAFSGAFEFTGVSDLNTSCATGIFPRVNSNYLGQLSGTILFMLFIRFVFIKRRVTIPDFISSIIIIYAFYFSRARTSYLAFLSILAFLFWYRKSLGLFLLFIVLTFFVYTLRSTFVLHFSGGQNSEELIGMSGRLNNWQIAVNSYFDSPYFGKGFYSGHKSIPINLERVSTLDNTYLDVLIDLGAFGFSVFLFFLLNLYSKVFSLIRGCFSIDYFCAFATLAIIWFMFIRSLTGPTYGFFDYNLVVVFMLLVSAEIFAEKQTGQGVS